MATASAARKAACALLGDVRRRDARARDLLRASARMERLSERDRALATRLVLGVTASVGMLDATLSRHLSGRAHLEPAVRDALRLATYELLFLSTPASVAVSQGVELVRLARRRAAGLANAVLRKVAHADVPARRAACERVAQGGASAADLALSSGYPAWLIEAVMAERGPQAARELCRAASDPAPVYVAANAALVSDDEAYALLSQSGLEPMGTEFEGSYVLRSPAPLARSQLVQEARVVPADLSAQRVARMAAPRPGSRVLEVGQGRGTKSLLLESVALRAGGPVWIAGVDAEAFKVEVACERMRRAGVGEWVGCHCLDALELGGTNPPEPLDAGYDLVFVDAPCSGTGTLRRHPEICWSLAPGDVAALAKLQLGILGAAADRVRRGGVLCYATCSVLREENEGVVQAFLSSAQGTCFAPDGPAWQGMPAPNGPDGHFCQLLRRE